MPSFKCKPYLLLFGTPLWNNGKASHLDKKISESLQKNKDKNGGKKELFVNSLIIFTFFHRDGC